MKTILVDMDGVLAWWEKAFINEMRANVPHIPVMDFGTRTSEDKAFIHEVLTNPEAQSVLSKPGFYRNLLPVEGGKQALEEMLEAGFDVAICTAPSTKNLYCGTEKMEWVREHLGEEWLQRLIITRDKTRVKGDYLIDDKETVTGSQNPEWEHILYTQSYNRSVLDKRRLNQWSDWRALFEMETNH